MVPRIFADTTRLQDFLLYQDLAGTRVVVPHQRLAQQLWHRQRLLARREGRFAWQPLPLITLQSWVTELFNSLWPQEVLAPALVRLALWRRALQAAPAPAGPTPELQWAESLDETYTLLCRHGLLDLDPNEHDSPLVAWRRRVTCLYADLIREGGWITPGELPAYLIKLLRQGKVTIPKRLLVVGLETPGPAEGLFLEEVGRRTEMIHLQVRGDLTAVQRAVAFPDPDQEVAWVGAKLVELAKHLPLHQMAITSPEIDRYAGQLRRVLGDLLGPPHSADGWAYNFSQGPHLHETPLFEAALLPLTFIAAGERREDFISLLLSSYYGRLQEQQERLALWDRVLREQRVEEGWGRIRAAVTGKPGAGTEVDILNYLDRFWGSWRDARAPARQWTGKLCEFWRVLGFPLALEETEIVQWTHLNQLLQDLGMALGPEELAAGDFLEWLSHGGRQMVLPGPGIQEAGIQVLGLLEMRGLAFDQVFCLGMNSVTFPAPPRPLPLLTSAEKHEVLGGTFLSQHRFARELWDNLLGTSHHLTLTRPLLVDQEDRVSTPMYLGAWDQAEMPVLSLPHPAWLRVPAVQAAFQFPEPVDLPPRTTSPVVITLPGEISLSQVRTALECPCRFLLEPLLRIRDLPEIEAGLDPRERGKRLHEVLAQFTLQFKEILDRRETWDQEQALKLLEATVYQALIPLVSDFHWQAEWDRWLGEGGLLREWLAKEHARFREGWRWQGMEVEFEDLRGEEWVLGLKGRIDRLDYHAANGEVVVWDYKSGEVPKAAKVFADQEESQLACYLLAVRRGRAGVGSAAGRLKAGFIGLKSPRAHHLKYEDFGAQEEDWERLMTAFEERLVALGRRLAAGDFSPAPTPAPQEKTSGACQYCTYGLVCGYVRQPATVGEDLE